MEKLFLLLPRLTVTAAFLAFTVFPQQALAFEYEQGLLRQHLEFLREEELGRPQVAGASETAERQTVIPQPGQIFTVTASAYSSTAAETDSDPFITASGSITHLGTLAANWLPLGTVVRLGGQAYTVEDRMHSRFDGQGRVDIWMNSSEMAQQFGVRTLALEIVHLP